MTDSENINTMTSDESDSVFENQRQQRLSWIGNIKEMARQVAALTRTSTYRHSSIPPKDLTFFGNNHSLSPTSQLSLNGTLVVNDFSVFKTPPEGRTPVDVKHFDYGEETLRTLEKHNQLVDFCNGDLNHLNDSGLSQEGSLSGVEQSYKTCDVDVSKVDDDSFHTPPEFQDDVLMLPSDKLITSVIDLLSKCAPENSQVPKTVDVENSSDDTISSPKVCENTDIEETMMCTEEALSEKDSLDSSPVGSRRFTQEEDDSGISTVDENDVSRDSPTTPQDASYTDRKVKDKSNNKRTPSEHSSPKLDKRTGAVVHPGVDVDKHHGKTYTQEPEDSVGWQTRCRRTARKREEFERKGHYSNNRNTDTYGQSERSNMNGDYPRRGARDGKYRERNSKIDNKTYCTPATSQGENVSEDSINYTSSKNGGAWKNRRTGDNDVGEEVSSSKRNGRSYNGGKRSENRCGKNGSKETLSEMENGKEQVLGDMLDTMPNVFSYRDALLKASSSKDTNQGPTSKGEKTVFDLNAAAHYLSSAWNNVKNLHRKDPSKVYIFSDD